MLNAAFGLQQLNQAWATPARISQGQKGLFDQLGEALNPTPQIDVQDPSSVRQAAQHAMNKGDTVEGSRLMQQAQQIEQRQTEMANENIKRSYAAMEAKGPEALAKFESAMAQAGKTDILAGVKRERMRDKVLEMQVGSAEEAQEVKGLVNAYYGATTPQGKEEAKNILRERGFGEQVFKIEQQESQIAMQESQNAFDQEAMIQARAKQAVDAKPIYTDEKAHAKWLETQPETVRAYADMRRAKYLSDMSDYEDLDTKEKVTALDESLIEEAGYTPEQYATLRTGLGPLDANKEIMKRVNTIRASADAGSSKNSTPSTSKVNNARTYIEEAMKDDETLEMFEDRTQQLAQLTAEISENEGLMMGPALEKAQTQLAEQIAKEEAPKTSGDARRKRRADRMKVQEGDARPTAMSTRDLIQGLSDEELAEAIARHSR